MSELPSSEDLDPSTGTDAPTPPTTTGPSSYTLNWEEPLMPVATWRGHAILTGCSSDVKGAAHRKRRPPAALDVRASAALPVRGNRAGPWPARSIACPHQAPDASIRVKLA